MNINKFSIKKLAFLQALGLAIYVGLIATMFHYVDKIFGNEPDNYLAPVFMLTLLVFSVLICGILTLGRFAYLFWEKKYKDAYTLLGYTIGWIFIYWVLIAIIIAVK